MNKTLSDLSKELQWETHYDEVTAETFGKIVNLSDQIDKEVNSKIKMPKCFDAWYNELEGESNAALRRITLMFTSIFYEIQSIEEDKLTSWLFKTNADQHYEMCIDAIINGYEVENDE